MSLEEPLHNASEKETPCGDVGESMDVWPPAASCDSITTDNDSIYTSEPLPFIQSMPHGQLVVNHLARDMLSRINKPLVVISVAGLYRTGKGKIAMNDKIT